VVVAGGKYTTYRVMAEDAVDRAAELLDQQVAPCVTEDVPTLGAEGFSALWNRRHALATASGLHVARIEHLLGRYGNRTEDVLAMLADFPDLARPLPNADDYLEIEVRYSALAEGALHLDDALTRRTRISIESFDRGLAAAERAVDLMGDALDWDDDRRRNELDYYRGRVAAERDSQQQPDDRTADAARMGDGRSFGLGAAEALVRSS
jgi:glycerol-3-phosphate dehydrogenase